VSKQSEDDKRSSMHYDMSKLVRSLVGRVLRVKSSNKLPSHIQNLLQNYDPHTVDVDAIAKAIYSYKIGSNSESESSKSTTEKSNN
jgi:2-phosphoglycerate kinase